MQASINNLYENIIKVKYDTETKKNLKCLAMKLS